MKAIVLVAKATVWLARPGPSTCRSISRRRLCRCSPRAFRALCRWTQRRALDPLRSDADRLSTGPRPFIDILQMNPCNGANSSILLGSDEPWADEASPSLPDIQIDTAPSVPRTQRHQ
jgi:hypothetical protein